MQYTLLAISLVILLSVLLLLTYCFYKIRRVDKNVSELLFRVAKIQRTDLIDIFQQRQNLDILQSELSLRGPLPPTRGWAASPDFLLTVARYAHEQQPERIVECSSGVSTLVLASCMRDNGKGHVYSLENDEIFAKVTRANLEREGLSDWATVLHAPLIPQEAGGRQYNWYDHRNLPEGEIDMVVVDGPPHLVGSMARYPAGPKLFPRLSSGATVFADDAARAEEEPTLDAWRQEFPDFVETNHYCEKGCISFRKP